MKPSVKRVALSLFHAVCVFWWGTIGYGFARTGEYKLAEAYIIILILFWIVVRDQNVLTRQIKKDKTT